MKIVIFGSYNGGSVGDTAILLGMISSIFRVLGDSAEVTVLTMGHLKINEELQNLGGNQRVKEIPIYRKFDGSFFGAGIILNKFWRFFKRIKNFPAINDSRVKNVLKDSEVLLIGGGNLVMDIYRRWPNILKKICELAVDSKIPYHFVGVGAGPIISLQGKYDLLFCLKSAESVYFRDSASKEYCKQHLDFNNSDIGPDLAFGIDWLRPSQTKKNDVLMLNIAAVYSERWPVKDIDKYNNYLSQMVILVDKLAEKLGVKKIVIFNTNYPLDEFAAKDFLIKYKEISKTSFSLKLLEGKYSVSKLLKVCSSANFSLVTRLHAGILSKISGANVFAIAYQPKVRDVMEMQTSQTLVESFDVLMSGSAFDPFIKGEAQFVSDKNTVTHNDVDKFFAAIMNKNM